MKFWALSYSLPANPSRYRVAVWKRLKEIGAIYLQPAVAVVPQRENLYEQLVALKDTVRSYGGKSALLSMDFTDKADEGVLLDEINKTRADEYREIARDTRRLAAQLEWEQNNGDPDVAHYQQECRHLRKRLEVALSHDFFGADGRDEAEDAIDIITSMLPADNAKARRGVRKMPTPPVKAARPAKPRAPKKPVEKPTVPAEKPVEPPKAETSEEPERNMPVFLF